MKTRATIAFPKWSPVQRDRYISYSYTLPATGRVVRHQDRWMRVPYLIAAAALHTGAVEFTVNGGLGVRQWTRTVTCTEEQADAWFRDQIAAGAFMLRGVYRKALLGQQRRVGVRAL